MRKKETFTLAIEDDDGKGVDKEFAVMEPDRDAVSLGRAAYSQALGAAMSNKAPLRAAIFKYMREQGLWDDDKEKEFQDLRQSLNDNEVALARGGIKLKDARQIAIDMRVNRLELRMLLAEQTQLDAYTVEGMAENARFDAMVSKCLIDVDTGQPVFSSSEEYELRKNDDVAVQGATIFAGLYYGYDIDAEAALPENTFLKKWGFVDGDLNLVNEQGHRISTKGDLVDDDGNVIDEDGNIITEGGHKIDTEGNLLVDTQPFLDDDGNPVEEPKTD